MEIPQRGGDAFVAQDGRHRHVRALLQGPGREGVPQDVGRHADVQARMPKRAGVWLRQSGARRLSFRSPPDGDLQRPKAVRQDVALADGGADAQ